jgi:NAD-dependent DNA ligase
MGAKQVNPAELERQIRMLNDAYREGFPQVTDEEFDDLVDLLKKINPYSNWFKRGVQDYAGDRKEKLPMPMYSLEKIKSYEEFMKWVASVRLQDSQMIVITPKYDGISLCVNECVGGAWTRGDGEFGQHCNLHFEMMRNNLWNPHGYDEIEFTFGEAIFRSDTFLKIKENSPYKSARNAVAGLINSPQISPLVQDITYVRYGCDREDWDKKTQLEFVNEASYCEYCKFTCIPLGSLIQNEESFLDQMNSLFERLTTNFKCDGLVIDINDANTRMKLGRLPNGNPKYAIAYKNPEWSEREETIVKHIDWQISKDGRLAPVVNVEPVELCGATVSKCSAYNARNVFNESISDGARIIIARSGDVIPKHLKTVKRPSKVILPDRCPNCGKMVYWDNNRVDLVCTNEDCDGILLAKCVYFFSILDFKEFREPTIKKIFNAGYKYPYQIIEMNEADLNEVEGLGKVAANYLAKQFDTLRKKGTNFAKLLTAINYFEGVIAEKTCQKILDGMMLFTKQEIVDFAEILDKGGVGRNMAYSDIANLSGIGETTAIAFMKGIDKWRNERGSHYDFIPITFYGLEEKTFEGQMTVVFTGFRSKEWENKLKEQGHKISNSVSKKTSCLVVKEKGSGSTKEQKAESLGVPIFTMQEFKEKFLL